MKDILAFLEELRQNNNREWFNANKSRYKEILAQFDTIANEVIARVGAFDADIAPLTLKECTYRIYRDTRFSPDKTPYKTHIGLYMSRGGKKSGYAGYYLHIEPSGSDGFLGGSLLACGLHCPEPNIVKSMREDIFARGELYADALKAAKGFKVDMNNTLKRTPAGYPADFKYDNWLRLKEFCPMKMVDLTQPKALDKCIEEFKRIKPINDLLNMAVDYAHGHAHGQNDRFTLI